MAPTCSDTQFDHRNETPKEASGGSLMRHWLLLQLARSLPSQRAEADCLKTDRVYTCDETLHAGTQRSYSLAQATDGSHCGKATPESPAALGSRSYDHQGLCMFAPFLAANTEEAHGTPTALFVSRGGSSKLS